MVLVLFVIFVVSVDADILDINGQCRLDPHPSVEYLCIVPGASDDSRVCSAYEPAGTLVNPRCRRPTYYSATSLPFMRCIDGYWDYIARCTPECGRVTPNGTGLVVGGTAAIRGELPWHAGIYSTTTDPYLQICGGSLISNNVVLSAAHCFWTDLEKQLPASMFAVAVGKLYRPWNDTKDQAQESQVKIIHLPRRYQGTSANFQDDIAVVIVAREFQFKTHIRPVCLSFDYHFEQQQLYTGNKGKVAGWGLTAADGKASPVLQVVDLPYVDVGTCINKSPPDYREYITSDKICAGTLEPNSALCRGDSGGGLVFPERVAGVERYYLRGVVSTAPSSDRACNTAPYTSFTALSKHEPFIKQYWIESGEFKCQDGSVITVAKHCDGARDCADGSDETEHACAKTPCSDYLFRCAYGACVDRGATCDGVSDCSDGSDEAHALCREAGTTLAVVNDTKAGMQICRGSLDSANVVITGYEFVDRTGHCYKFHTQARNWTAANSTCAAEGARLAVANTAEEETLLTELFKKHPAAALPNILYKNHVAVGVYRDSGAWKTVDGPTLGVHAGWWYPGWPRDEDNNRYGFMERDGKLENYSLHYVIVPFICEKVPTSPD